MTWIKTLERLPEREPNVRYSNPRCLVVYKGNVQILCFNHEHECWDQEDGDEMPEGPRQSVPDRIKQLFGA